MIKLIASDLDGTLLDDDKNLPPDFYEVLDGLSKKGIRFVVSSGRTLDAVEHLFKEEYRKKMDYICDNGAGLYLAGKPAAITPLDRSTFLELLDACERIGGLKVLVCSESGTYHLPGDPVFEGYVARFYKNHFSISDLRLVKGTVFKLAVCDEAGTEQHGKPALDAIMGDKLNVQVSGKIWMDVMGAGVSKGAALRKLMEMTGVSAEETMAFGDYFNDVDMLSAAGMSFCMENGHEEVKKLCRYIAHANNEYGVTRAIKEYALAC